MIFARVKKYHISLIICLSLLGCRRNSVSADATFSQDVIVYSNENNYIHTMNADGSNKKELFNEQCTSPKWSPKGDLIGAYWWDITAGEHWLVAFDVGKGAMVKLAFIQGYSDFGILTFAWSPDGRVIAFSRTKGGFAESELFTVDVNGITVKQLTNGGFNYSPRWSPNGQQIAYEVEEGRPDFSYIMNKDGSGNQPAPYRARGLVANLVWSPDGASVAFNGPPDSSFIGTTTMDIYVSDTEAKQVKRLTDDKMSGVPSWSPDGNFIAFVSRRDGGLNAYVMRRNGSEQIKITSHGKVLGGPLLWSPNGTRLLYPYDHSQNSTTIAVAASDGSSDLDLEVSALGGFSWKY